MDELPERVRLNTLSASPSGPYTPGVYRVGDQVPEEVARGWLETGHAEPVRGREMETATEPQPEESGAEQTEPPEEEATEPQPEEDEAAGEYTVESTGGGWYAILGPDGEEVDKVQGRENAEDRRDELAEG